MKVALIGAGENGVAHMRSLAVIEDITLVGIAAAARTTVDNLYKFGYYSFSRLIKLITFYKI